MVSSVSLYYTDIINNVASCFNFHSVGTPSASILKHFCFNNAHPFEKWMTLPSKNIKNTVLIFKIKLLHIWHQVC